MRDKSSIKGVRNSYRKRQRIAPFIVGGIAIVLLVVGALFVALSLSQGGFKFTLFSTKTPSPTLTYTPTLTPTITETPTITSTPPPSVTPTTAPTNSPSGPFTYIVEEGDTLTAIAGKFGIDMLYLMEINNLSNGVIFVGQELIVPPPNAVAPTGTPVPSGLPRGRIIEVRVIANDSLNGLASKYNSTVEAILEANKDILKDANSVLFIGQMLKIPVNLVTPTKTATPPISVRQTQTQEALQGTPTP